MKFDLEDLNPPTWFEDGEGGAIAVRVCADEDLDRIREATTSKKTEMRKMKDGTWQRVTNRDVDQKKQDELIWDHCVVDWRGMDTPDGPLECTTEHKVKLMRGSVRFASWVGDCLAQLSAELTVRVDQLEKN